MPSKTSKPNQPRGEPLAQRDVNIAPSPKPEASKGDASKTATKKAMTKSAAPAGKKRSSDAADLDKEEPFTFDKDLHLGPDEDDEDLTTEDFKYSCNQVRSKLRALVESGEYKAGALRKELGATSSTYNRFMKFSKPWQGAETSVFQPAHEFILQREAAGKKTPRKRSKPDRSRRSTRSG